MEIIFNFDLEISVQNKPIEDFFSLIGVDKVDITEKTLNQFGALELFSM